MQIIDKHRYLWYSTNSVLYVFAYFFHIILIMWLFIAKEYKASAASTVHSAMIWVLLFAKAPVFEFFFGEYLPFHTIFVKGFCEIFGEIFQNHP